MQYFYRIVFVPDDAGMSLCRHTESSLYVAAALPCCGMKGGVGVFGVCSWLISDQLPVCLSVYTELRYEQENPC